MKIPNLDEIRGALPPSTKGRWKGRSLPGALPEWPFLFLFLLLALVHWPVIAGRSFFFRDVYLLSQPSLGFLGDSLRQGRIPLWNPFLHAGSPFLANPQSLATYPPAWLFSLISPAERAVDALIVFHLAIAAAGAYLLARTLTLQPLAAFVAAVSFAFSGLLLSTTNLTFGLVGVVWLPGSLAALERAIETGSRFLLAVAALAFGMTVLAGVPEMIVISAMSLGAWSLLAPVSGRRGRALWAGAIVLLGGIGLGGVRLATTLALVRATPRSGLSFEDLTLRSLSPRALPELVLSGFMGRTGSLLEEAYWGRLLTDSGFPYYVSISFGLLVVCLAVAGLKARGWPLRFRIALAMAAGAGVAGSLGRYLPGARELLFPLLGPVAVRYPVKALFLAAVPLALLAAAGFEELGGRWRSVRSALVFVVPGGLLALSAALLPFVVGWSVGYFGVPAEERTLFFIVLRGVGLLAMAAVSVALLPAPLGRAVLAAAVAFELASGAAGIEPTVPAGALRNESAPLLRRVVGDGRLYAVPVGPPYEITAATDDVRWLAAWKVSIADDYTGFRDRIRVAFHSDFDALAPVRVATLSRRVASLPWGKAKTELLSAFGVRAVISRSRLESAGLEPVAEIENASGKNAIVHRNPRGTNAWFSPSFRVADGPRNAFALLCDPVTSPIESPILEISGSALSSTSPSEPLRISRNSPEEIDVEVEAASRGVVVVAETPFPGWKATVDGSPARIDVANFSEMGILVGPGKHSVALRYRTPGLDLGLALSLGTVAAGLLALALSGRRG
jgi:hypothetical protein